MRLHAELARGALARRADRALVPAARDRWSFSETSLLLHVEPEKISAGNVLSWLRERVSGAFDPRTGKAWQLSAANTTDGGSVLSLVCAHAIADGAAMIDAVLRANGTAPALPAPARPRLPAALLSDVVDAAGQLRDVARWAVRARIPKSPPGQPKPVENRAADPQWTVPHVIAECDTAELAAAAGRHGGSVTTLFAAALTRIARSTSAPDAETIKVALPVSGRTEDDTRCNTTRIAMAAFTADALGTRDLAALKEESKRAYRALATPAPQAVPLALLQMLPDRVIRKLPAPPPATVLASSLGTVPEEFRTIGGAEATSVAATAHYPGIGPAEVATIGRGVIGWLTTAGERTTISVCGLDPAGIADTTRLAELVTAEFADWGTGVTTW